MRMREIMRNKDSKVSPRFLSLLLMLEMPIYSFLGVCDRWNQWYSRWRIIPNVVQCWHQIQCTLYHVQRTLYQVLCALYHVQRTLIKYQCDLWLVQRALFFVPEYAQFTQWILNVTCTSCNVRCRLHLKIAPLIHVSVSENIQIQIPRSILALSSSDHHITWLVLFATWLVYLCSQSRRL